MFFLDRDFKFLPKIYVSLFPFNRISARDYMFQVSLHIYVANGLCTEMMFISFNPFP